MLCVASACRADRSCCVLRQGCADAGGSACSADLQLVVRRWQDISPAAEFRCFVVEGHLIGTGPTGARRRVTRNRLTFDCLISGVVLD